MTNRVTQETVEVASDGDPVPARLTQVVAEAAGPYQHEARNARLSQEVVEAAGPYQHEARNATVTQIVVEVISPSDSPIEPTGGSFAQLFAQM